MLRKMTITLAVAGMLSAMLATMPAQANNSVGVGAALFGCNITIKFPNSPKGPAKTNCNGDAFGVSAFATGAKLGTVGTATGTLDPLNLFKDPVHNFQAYNVQYEEACLNGEPVPLVGLANGHAIIAGDNGKRIHTFFEWTRVGVTAVTFLYNAHTEPGGLNPAHKTKKDGTPLGKGAVTDRPDGVAIAAFDAKPPVGSCASPNPQQAITVVGLVVAGLNLKSIL